MPTRKRSVKGLLRRFLSKLTGLSRAQLTRLIGQFLREKCVRPTAYRRCRFPTKYSRADIVLLAHVDQVQQRLSGPATRRILQREFQIYNRKEFERLAELSVGHLYNLRKRAVYRRHSLHLDKTRPTPVAIGERRQPEPRGRPGYLRIDTVHSPEQEGEKGAYSINVVDEVTQWQAVGCVQRINENHLIPLLEGLLEQFPFIVRGFHSDNGSEFVNHQTAKLLEKLRIEFTKSRARRSNDNALVETKNGAVVRKWMGYQFLPSEATQAIDTFYRQWLNPYLNFHRPCAFASERRDPPRQVAQGVRRVEHAVGKAAQPARRAARPARGSLAQEAPSASGHLFRHRVCRATRRSAQRTATRLQRPRDLLAHAVDNAPTRGVVGSSGPRPKTAVGSRLGWLQRGIGVPPLPPYAIPLNPPYEATNSCSRRPQLTL